MATEQRILKPDGYLDVPNSGTSTSTTTNITEEAEEEHIETRSIVYHPNLNVILVFDSINRVKVLDVHSGVVLQTYHLGNGKCFACRFVPDFFLLFRHTIHNMNESVVSSIAAVSLLRFVVYNTRRESSVVRTLSGECM